MLLFLVLLLLLTLLFTVFFSNLLFSFVAILCMLNPMFHKYFVPQIIYSYRRLCFILFWSLSNRYLVTWFFLLLGIPEEKQYVLKGYLVFLKIKRCLIWTEAVTRRCSVKKVFLQIFQNSQKNTGVRVSFFNSPFRLTSLILRKNSNSKIRHCGGQAM